MKQIWKNHISGVNSKKYYGILTMYDDKGFLTREGFLKGKYIWRCIYDITDGNGWNIMNDRSLKGAIKKALKEEMDVYEFDDEREFKNWLLKD